MKSIPISVLAVGLFASSVITSTGCNTGVLPESALSMDTAAASAATDPLNAVVSGDMAAGFRDHVAAVSAEQVDGAAVDAAADAATPAGSLGLSNDERAQIETLQAQLDSGEITAEEFAAQADAILGDLAPRAAFGGLGFFGSPFGDRIRNHVAGMLRLTEEQQAAARAIFERTHQQIRILRLTALANVRLQLTEELRAKLDQLRDERFASIREEAAVPPGAFRGRGFLPGRPGERRGQDAIRERVRGFFERLADELGITEEQRTAIQRIREQLRADVRAAHEAARTEFKALLTAEQLAILERIEARIEARLDRHDDGAPGRDVDGDAGDQDEDGGGDEGRA